MHNMQNQMFDYWTRSSKFPQFEPLIELGIITTRLYGDIAKENLKAMNDLMQSSAQQWQDLSQAKELSSVWDVQSKWAAHAAPQWFEHNQHILDRMLESATEYRRWLENGMQQFAKTEKSVERSENRSMHDNKMHRK